MVLRSSQFATMLTLSAALHASTLLFPWGSIFSVSDAPQKLRITFTQYDEVSAETAAPQPVLKQQRATQQLLSPQRVMPKIKPKQSRVKKAPGNTVPVSHTTQQKRINRIDAPDPISHQTLLQRKKAESFKIAYEEAIVAWLEKHKRYPRRALKRNIEGTGVLALSLSPHGKVIDRRLKSSSGCDLLDEEITRMVDRAGSFPKVPEGLPQRATSFVIPIQFQIS